MAKVKITIGATVNLGNFENIKFDLSYEEDCNALTYNKAYKGMKKLLTKDVATTVKELKKDGRARFNFDEGNKSYV